MAKRALITGGAGFIAHHLIGHLLRNTDWEIVTLDRPNSGGDHNRLHDLLMHDHNAQERKRVAVLHHDLKAELDPLISSRIGKVDYILHLAAAAQVDRSIQFPTDFVMDNVVGTCNILQFARNQHNLERFVYFSTGEVFGPAPDRIRYQENDRYNSTNPYSATKAGGEELAVAFENTYGLPVYITHTMNVFGQRQHPEKFIPICIKRIRDGEVVTILSDKTQTIAGSRHYIHADDVSSALVFILNLKGEFEPQFGGAKCPKFNIVGAEELSNLELALSIATIQGQELKYKMVDFHSSRPGHDLRYALCGEKLKQLGWEPKKRVRERVAEVTQWTLDNARWL